MILSKQGRRNNIVPIQLERWLHWRLSTNLALSLIEMYLNCVYDDLEKFVIGIHHSILGSKFTMLSNWITALLVEVNLHRQTDATCLLSQSKGDQRKNHHRQHK